MTRQSAQNCAASLRALRNSLPPGELRSAVDNAYWACVNEAARPRLTKMQALRRVPSFFWRFCRLSLRVALVWNVYMDCSIRDRKERLADWKSRVRGTPLYLEFERLEVEERKILEAWE